MIGFKIFLCLFIYPVSKSLQAEYVSNNNAYQINENILQHDAGYVKPIPKKCSDILNMFAQYAANFTLCSIKYGRPIRLCEKCIEHYMNFSDKYKELLHNEVNGSSCWSYFTSQDRLDAVLENHDHIQAIWDKGHCYDCFDWSYGRPQLSNNTLKFNKMYNDTQTCITSNLNPYQNNSDEVCTTCMLSYVRLDEYYKSLSKDSIGVDGICMDIVDSMNATRSMWSINLNCCKLRKSPEIIFLCCTGIISVLPLLFYVIVRYYGPIRDLPNVLKESRFKESFLRSVQGRIN